MLFSHYFDMYMNRLSVYNEEYVINYWITSLYEELESNHGIENLKFDIRTLLDNSVFFDTLNINGKRIHELHNFVTKKEIEEGILKDRKNTCSTFLLSYFDMTSNHNISLFYKYKYFFIKKYYPINKNF